MGTQRANWVFALTLVGGVSSVAATVLVGCRDQAPVPAFEDLGDEQRSLLPTDAPWKNAAVRSGQAEWVPYHAPGSAGDESAEEVANGETGEDQVDTARIEEEIRALIVDYNAVALERNLDELIKYHLPSQQDALRPLLTAGVSMLEKLARLRTLLDEKLPGQGDRVQAVFDALGGSSPALKVDSLTVVSHAEVTARLPGTQFGGACRFVMEDEDWFIDVPGLESVVQAQPRVEAALQQFDVLLERLDSGAAGAEQILAALEAAAKSLAPQPSPPPDEEVATPDETGGD